MVPNPAQTELVRQFPDKAYIPKIKILSTSRNGNNEVIIRAFVESGIVKNGDIIKVPLKDGSDNLRVLNVYINGQQTTLGVAGEEVEIIARASQHPKVLSQFKEKFSESTQNIEIPAIVISQELVELLATGTAYTLYKNKRINENRFSFLMECPILREKIIRNDNLFLREDGLLDKVKDAGIAALKGTVKSLAIPTAIGIFVYHQLSKLNKECLTKLGKNRLICNKKAIERLLAELRRQSAECNTLADPKKRRDCLKTVEKTRAKYIKKLAEINEKISKYKPEEEEEKA